MSSSASLDCGVIRTISGTFSGDHLITTVLSQNGDAVIKNDRLIKFVACLYACVFLYKVKQLG